MNFRHHRRRRRARSAASLSAAVEALEFRRLLSAGDLDPTFSDDGVVISSVGDDEVVEDTVVQSDGKVIAVGSVVNNGTRNAFVARYTASGALDTTFHGDGFDIVDFPGGEESANSVLIRPGGQIVVGGSGAGGWVRQYSGAGTDDTFAPDGTRTGIGDVDAMTLLANGKLLTGAGETLRRLNSDGTPDTTFGASGARDLTDLAYGPEVDGTMVSFEIVDIDIQPGSGDVLVSGDVNRSATTGEQGVAVLGIADHGDAASSTFTSHLLGLSDGTNWSMGTVIQQSGRVITAWNHDGETIRMEGYTTSGAADASFGAGSKATGIGSDIALDSSDRIIVGGVERMPAYWWMEAEHRAMVALRFTPDGLRDKSFDLDGHTFVWPEGGVAGAAAMAVAPDGKIVLVGGRNEDFSPLAYPFTDVVVARFQGGSSPLAIGADGKLVIDLSAAAESLELTADGNALEVRKNNVLLDTIHFPAGATPDVIVNAGAGWDDIAANGNMTLVVNAGDGNDTLHLNAGPSADVTFNGGMQAGSSDTLNVNAGTYTFDNDAALTTSNLTVNVAAGADVVFNATQHLAALNIAGGGARLSAAGDRVINTRDLSITDGGALDLTDNGLILDYAAGEANPLGAWDGSKYTGVSGLLAAGYNYTAWDGPGIITSMPTANTGLTTLAIADAPALFGISGAETASWGGHTIDVTTVLIKYTYAGDANQDGIIDAGDYGIIDNFVQIAGASGYWRGDFNYDGFIDAGDYGIIDNNIQAQRSREGTAVITPDRTLLITGTDDADGIYLTQMSAALNVSVNGKEFLFDVGDVDRVTVDALGSNDVINIAHGEFNDGGSYSIPTTVNSGDGNDSVMLTAASNVSVVGGTGNDTVDLDEDAAVTGFDGGSGVDSYTNHYYGTIDTITLHPTVENATTQNVSIIGNDLANVLRVMLYGSIDGAGGNDSITGGDMRDFGGALLGGAGNDTIVGWGANDRIDGGAGDDLLRVNVFNVDDEVHGGDGVDTADFSFNTRDLNIHLGVFMQDVLFVSDDIETVFGGGGNDRIVGSAAANRIAGNGGDDTLIGNGGDDTLLGGDGNDSLEGGAGDDHLEGHAGNDTLRGGDHNDRLFGGSGNDHLFGDAGDDLLYGQNNADILDGGAGNDSGFDDGEDTLTSIETVLT